MKDKKKLWIFLGAAVFICAACGIITTVVSFLVPNSIEMVGDNYLTAVQNQDYVEAVRWTHPISDMSEDVLSEFFAGMNITDWDFDPPVIEDGTATLEGTIVINGGRRPIRLFFYYSEGDWWVVSITLPYSLS